MVEQSLSEPVSWRGRRRRLVLGFGALLVLAGLFTAIVVNAVQADKHRREAESWYVHTFEVLVAVERLRATVNMAIRGERGYLITGDEKFLDSYDYARENTPRLLAQLTQQTRDNPGQREHLATLERRLAGYHGVLERAIALTRDQRGSEAVALVRSGAGLHQIEAVLTSLDAVRDEENALLAVRSAENARANALIGGHYYSLAGVGFAFLCVAAAAGLSTAGAQKRARAVAEQLRISATTDELTGLTNRRAFMQALEIELARSRRSGSPLSVAIADIDYFKRVNDTHGHGGGDEVLRRVAEIATDTMRLGDVVARLGGEEFAVLMPDTDESQARIACERLRAALAARPVKLSTGADVPVTLSTGVALLNPGEDKDRLVTRADNALYRAKAEGRNQVRMAA